MVDEVHVEIRLPRKLYEEALKRAKEAGFNDFNEFIVFVLEQLITIEEKSEVFSKEDEEKVKERLRALGYL